MAHVDPTPSCVGVPQSPVAHVITAPLFAWIQETFAPLTARLDGGFCSEGSAIGLPLHPQLAHVITLSLL